MLGLALVLPPLCLLLEVRSDERVGLPGPAALRLPPLCLPREWFGITCPGCGLTRSFIHLAHGDWDASVQAHPVGWVLAAALFLQIPYRIRELCRPDQPLLSPLATRFVTHALIAVLVIAWSLRLLARSGAPY